MNQTSLIGRPLSKLASAVVGFAEKRGVWSGPLTSSSPELARLWAAPHSTTGVSVTEMSALTYSVVWACVNNISTDVASLPLMLYKRLPNGGKQPLTDHKLYRILHDEPNSEMSSMTFRGMVQAHALTWGNGYAEIVRDGGGKVATLEPITPDRVTPRRNINTGRLLYEVSRTDGGIDLVDAANMLHIQGLGYDGTVGYNLIAQAREAIALGLATQSFGGTFFGNGTTFGGVISLKEQLTEQAKKSFREQMQAQHQGVEQAHKFLLLGNEATYARLGVEPNNAQFLETRLLQVEEICRYYRMPPHKVQHLERSTNNNIEHQGIEYYSDTLRPWCVRWEQEIRRKLIAPSERMIQLAEHKIDGVLRGDLQSRYAAYAVGRQWGWLSANNICELENMNPLPAGGDIFLVPQNMAPADRINDIITAQIAPKPAPVTVGRSDEGVDAERMAQEIRKAITDAEQRAEAHLERAVQAEADAVQWKDSAATFTAEAQKERAAAVTACEETMALRAVLIEAEQRADRLALEQEAERAEKDAITAQLAETEARRLTTETAHVEAHQRAERLQAERDGLETQRADAEAKLAMLAVQHADAVAVLQTAAASERATAEQRVADLGASQDELRLAQEVRATELQQRDADLAEAKERESTLTATLELLREEASATATRAGTYAAERDTIRATADEAATAHAAKLAEEQAARADLEKQLADIHAYRETLLAQVATLEAEKATVAQEAEAARAATVAAETLRTAAEQRAEEQATMVTEAQTARAQTETTLRTLQDAGATRTQALLTAHRDLILDAMAPIIWKETDRARKNKATPAKLKAWADGFYLLQEDSCVDQLRAVMRTHLVFIGSTQDVDTYTRGIMHAHLEAAQAQLRSVANGDVDDFPVAIEKLLTRWEQERPAAIADVVLQEEITYVRSL